MFRKNARIASQQEFASWSKNKSSMKAKGLRMVLETGELVTYRFDGQCNRCILESLEKRQRCSQS